MYLDAMVLGTDFVVSRLSSSEKYFFQIAVSIGIGGSTDVVRDRRYQSAEGGAGL